MDGKVRHLVHRSRKQSRKHPYVKESQRTPLICILLTMHSKLYLSIAPPQGSVEVFHAQFPSLRMSHELRAVLWLEKQTKSIALRFFYNTVYQYHFLLMLYKNKNHIHVNYKAYKSHISLKCIFLMYCLHRV